jgi:hypothetical protein
MVFTLEGRAAQELVKQRSMLGLPETGEFAHPRTAETGMKCLNSLKQLLGIAPASLLARNSQRIERATKIAGVEPHCAIKSVAGTVRQASDGSSPELPKPMKYSD